ncbi:DeoR/GlpR family DNA-binding transcription regulator [Rhodoplanes serenus]|uniref:DeoR/GlpR family DNA-binding transcription regulator n=1 Tax=Rhodoplanes serenus TaxID=200615 RepID=UPI000DAE6E82|nr:DeoR/GlpR family DNA-binding transcription regulator [Rhodoplanes serenus]RAI31316.1 DeoR family transcriptional regulator [Rhodoplanes serenus]
MRRRREREQQILDLIQAGEADVDALAGRLDVSPSTIRRDLQRLSDSGAVMRTYGGAVLSRPAAEATLSSREHINLQAKQAIAAMAATLVADGDRVLLDVGSTVEALGLRIKDRRIAVVTNNLALVPVFAQSETIELTLLGGNVRPISMGTFGPLAELAIRRLTVDKLFLGADGVVAGRGLCEATPEQVALKERMVEQASAVYLLADASKLGNAHQPAWLPLNRPWTLVTDAGATAEQLRPFRALPGVTVMVAEGDGPLA